ncbi:partial Glycerol-3-phosphate dehydrogenase [NAD(P)+], partial [Candidatus Brocadiaceae bacterium]
MRIGVLGAGAWGTTLAILLHYNGHQVTLWEYKKKYAKELDKKRENYLLLPGIQIPEEMEITYDLETATENKNLLVLAIPSQFTREVIAKISYNDIRDTVLV